MLTKFFQYTIPENFYNCYLRLDAAKSNQFKWRISKSQYAIEIGATTKANQKNIRVFTDSFGTKLLRFEAEISELDAESTLLKGQFEIQKDEWVNHIVLVILLFATVGFKLWVFAIFFLINEILYFNTMRKDQQILLKKICAVMAGE